ncbi:MAG TPA: hypothetical protein VIM05_06125 [Gaiellaceae bacterium]
MAESTAANAAINLGGDCMEFTGAGSTPKVAFFAPNGGIHATKGVWLNDGSVFAPNDPNGQCTFTGQGKRRERSPRVRHSHAQQQRPELHGNGPDQGGETGTIVTIATGHTAGLEG